MPPRRSSRLSAEPERAAPAAVPKRKRTQSNASSTEEKENVLKATIGRQASAARSTARTRTRSSLKDVMESDEEKENAVEEEDEARPPMKKPRSSPEVDNEDSEGNVAPRRGSRKVATAKKPSFKEKKSRVVVKQEEMDNEGKGLLADEKDVPGPSRTSRSRGGSKAGTKSKKVLEYDEEPDPEQPKEDNEVDNEAEKDDLTLGDEESSGSGEEISRPSRGRKSKPHSKASNSKFILSKAEKTNTSENESHGTEGPANHSDPSVVVEQEEERSLLDPPQPAAHSSQPAAMSVIEEPKGPTSRLVIHKMALVNFKSYAGRQEIGPFHKSFSSIVGPNGSGKSNTIDALLFVFGYRASKMRQGKLSELIHNSARYPDLDECSVEVHFRDIIDMPGPDAFEAIPGSQLIVARTAYKNNTSKYTINNRPSNFTEVQTLLKGRGIDLDHKRFLILQGEVESIAQMKPKAQNEHEDGLLEYLEDIIGTSQYKEPIEQALTDMDALSEERVEKLNRLRHVEKEKKRLQEGKKEAEDWLRLRNEWTRATSRLYQWYLWKCLENEEQFAQKIAHLEAELAEETERNKDDITHLEMLEKHYEEREKAYEEVKAAAAEAMKDLAAHEREEVGLEERRKHANTKAKKLKKSLQEDEHAKAEAIRSIKESSDKIEREKGKLEQHEIDLEKEENVLLGIRDSLKDKTQVFHDQIEVKQKELQPWTSKINTKQAEIDLATSEMDTLVKKADAVKEAVKEAVDSLANLKEDHATKVTELDETKAQRADLQQNIRASEQRLQNIQAHVQELRGKASSSRQKVDEAKASQAASTSQNKVLDSLTKLRDTGRINGFHGRLGSLGTIPDKYDVAVSTACGALHNLVVDSVEQGQDCIEYLRKQNIGRASFMVLEKLQRNNGMEKFSTPENVPRLFDLIKPKEPRFAPAFYKGLGNTLVADDLEQANRIAFGGQRRWRVVTLAGQLIDSSGTMSGGGNHVARGGMSSKLAADTVRPETLRVYEKESQEAAQQLEGALQELRQVETELDELRHSGPQLDITLEKIALDIQTGSRRIADGKKRVEELSSQSKPDAGAKARIAQLDRDIQAWTGQLEDLQQKSGAIEAAIKELEKKILEIGGAKLLTQKSKVDGIRLHINLASDEITKAEVAKAKAEKDSKKLESAVESHSANLKEVDEEIETLDGQLTECRQFVMEIRSKVEAAQAAAENSKDDLDNLKSELDVKTEEIQVFRQKEMTLQQQIGDAKKESADNDKTLDHWRTEHDKLKLEEIDDDDEDEQAEEAQPDGDNPAQNTETGTEIKVKQEEGVPKKEREESSSFELHIYSVEELSAFRKREMVADCELLDEKLKNAKPNLSILKEYRKREEEFLKRAQDLDHITNLRDEQKRKYDALRKLRLDEFMAGFSLISMKLKEMYQMITLGGNAELELVDSMDPFSEGIIFSVMPPKKSWKNISNLSGGEKTLSSLALVFALHVFKPTPLYFMDEIDAALDFRNVSIVANYIKDRTKNAQFIIISLRNDMFELSHRLIGIYKTANATQSISIDNHALTAVSTRAS